MRTLQIIFVVLVVGVLLAVWSPWNNWDLSVTRLFGIEPPAEAAGLQVSSLAGTLNVYLDEVLVGEVDPSTSPLVVPGIEPGEKFVRIERVSDIDGAYADYSKLINFLSGVDVVLSYEIGPTLDFSEGHLISVVENNDTSDTTFVNVRSQPEGAKILVDGVDVGITPLILYPISTDQQHTITLQAEAHETQEFRILPAEQSERDKISGFTINVDARLFLQPIEVQ